MNRIAHKISHYTNLQQQTKLGAQVCKKAFFAFRMQSNIHSQMTIKCLTLLVLLSVPTFSLLEYCPNSYFFNSQHCEKCQDNCICQSEGTCQECVPGYTLYNSQCIQCPQSSGIYGQCSGCCSHESGTQLSCTDCTSVVGYYSFLFAGRCILSDGCFEVDSNGFCSECRTGYYETNNLCYGCDSSCATCTDSTNCLTCADGYYWSVESDNGGLCTACLTGCSTCDTNGTCYSCLPNYYLYTDHCLQCPTNCLSCVDGSTCTTCSAGILVSNLCIECTDTTYGGSVGCLTCQEDNNFIDCLSCDDLYFLDSTTGVCRLCSDYIVGAARCRDENTPTQCLNDYDAVYSNRYYLVGISCVANTKNCKQMLDVAGNCASCYEGYTLSLTNECEACDYTGCKTANQTVSGNTCQCTECDAGYYLTGSTPLCQTCTTVGCSICPGDTCTQCLPNYYLAGGNTCTSQVMANCLVLASATDCQTCDTGYYLGTDLQCYQCQANCLECSARLTCTVCASGYYLHPDSYCVKTPSNCLVYSTATFQCTLCEHGHYLFEGFCQSCTVEAGTLAKCAGLCPIDYYIQQLLISRANSEASLLLKQQILLLAVVWLASVATW